MDVLSYFLDVTGRSNAVSSALRLAVLAATAAVGFAAARKKRTFYVTFGILAVFSLLHFAVLSAYTAPSFEDAANLIRIYSLPVTAVSFAALFDADPRTVRAVFGAVTVNLAVIVLVMLISSLTGTDPHTYADKKIGTRGWFLGTNSQSAILSMVLPFALAFAAEQKHQRTFFVLSCSLVGSAALYFLAPRLAYAAIFGISLSFFVGAMILRKRATRTVSPIVFLVAPVLAAALFAYSPMTENRTRVAENAEIKAEISEGVLASGDAEDVYRHHLGALTERFGFDEVYAAYGGSLDPAELTNARLAKITYSRLLLRERPLCRVFGLDITSMTYLGENFDAENDFHGIYFLCGAVGLLLLFAFMLKFMLPFFRDAIKHPDTVHPYRFAAFVASVCGIVHAVFTAGVLRRPNASFYLALALAVMYAHVKKPSDHNDF